MSKLPDEVLCPATPTNSIQNTVRKIITLAVLISLSGCASGSGAGTLPRPSGPVAPCPTYANFETARLPDGRGWLQVIDSITRTVAAPDGGARRSTAEGDKAERETSQLFGVAINHAPRIRRSDRMLVRQLLEQTYPPHLRDQGLGGTVRMVLLMDASGKVREGRVARSSGHPSIDAAGLQMARQITFDPAIAGTCSVPYFVVLPITYMVATPTNPGPRP